MKILDPDKVADKATYENANQPAVGFQTVLVNGDFAVRNSKLVVDSDSGQPIRRSISK